MGKKEDGVQEDGSSDGGGGGKRVCGRKRGERNTGSRTIKVFYEYRTKFKKKKRF